MKPIGAGDEDPMVRRNFSKFLAMVMATTLLIAQTGVISADSHGVGEEALRDPSEQNISPDIITDSMLLNAGEESECKAVEGEKTTFRNFKACIQQTQSWEFCDQHCPYEDGSFPQEGPSTLPNPFADFEQPAGIWVPSPAELYLRGRLIGAPDRLGNSQTHFEFSGRR